MPDLPLPANRPPLVGHSTKDPAARIGYERHKFPLPKITGAGQTFVWPVGIEGFARTGAATLGVHKYLGRHYVDVHIVHLDEARIEMEGTFPGLTSTKNMRDLTAVLTAPGSKQLYLPGVFTNIQTVFTSDFDFRHGADDMTHSVEYRVSFVRTTTGAKIDTKNTLLNQIVSENPGPPKHVVAGNPDRSVQTTDGMRTFRAVADYVYQDADQWNSLLRLNKKEFSTYNADRGIDEPMNPFRLAIARLPLGARVRY